MNMSSFHATEAQWFLRVLITDPMSSIYVLRGSGTWQFAVEFIYRIYSCGLTDFAFDVLTKSEQSPNTTYDGIEDFCYHLSITDPDDFESIIWIDANIILTPFGRKLMEEYFKDSSKDWSNELNIPFIEKLEDIFTEHGLEWNLENPKFPVVGNSEYL
ncbi:hypothetical protein SAMN02745664_1207 [Moraxella cuniculi DSM 21768]|uniref:Uncharacterized protein n=1 Tax=Moraxella cuniculi DSM 21768 TaxID=1122245 RepID=A0A1N7FYX3_9GAMM|nr:hypothetical protein [Moraxella cuniculi]OOS04196.1 hypothetical protein B0189_08750 [Moraxella cuniculi]SIS05475.1 hypothetical protein SAMN02745664_1207 [Moraxella cuniculi DSM 21768]